MKKYLLFIPVILFASIYYINIKDAPPTELTISSEVSLDKLTGAEKFAMYHSNIRKSPVGSPYQYKSGYQVKEYQKLKKNAPQTSSRDLTWEERGPGNVSGRTRTLWLDPRDESGETWFVGSAQGGVWKTEDAGETYTLKTPDVPHMGTAAIMGCNSFPDVIYAGSGEGFNFLSAAGAGIFKSTDGGESWTVLESTTNNRVFANVLRMAVHPDNPDIVYAATRTNNSLTMVEGFVMKSIDGGETWVEVLQHFDAISDIVMSPADPDILFAGLNQEGVLKTVNGGADWNFVWIFDIPEERPGRIELAISPSDPNYVYFTTPIAVDNFFPEDHIFVSNNEGETFQLIIPNDAKDDYSAFSGGQSFWNKAITVDPFNPLKIYFAGQSAIHSMEVVVVEGLAIGEMSIIADGYGRYSDFFETSTKGVHVDHHGIFFSVVDEASQEVIMINTNDGGVAVSRDNGATFRQTGDTFLESFNPEGGNWETVDGYNVSTFYGVDKMNGADRYVGGTQDNGSWVSAEDPDASSIWSAAPSGDGFEAAWNYNDPNLIIESSQGNNFFKSTDGGELWIPMATPGFGPFITTIANSKQDGDMVAISTSDGPSVSHDFGESWITVQDLLEYNFSGLRTPIDISLADPRVVWTGTGVTQFSRILVSTDGGYSYTPTSQYGLQELGEVAGIATHPSDTSTAYALFGTSGQPKIIRTTDMGVTWEDISGFEGSTDGTSTRGFPDVAVFSLLVMPYDNNIIWAGTEIGIIESLDNGQSWNLIDDALPATAIWEMKIINDEVVVATHGRGIWTTSLPELEGYEPPVPFLIASKFEGISFDKKVSGMVNHLTPIDSGRLTVQIDVGTEILTKSIPLEGVLIPTEEEVSMSFEEFDLGDVIYEGILEITVFRENESRVRRLNQLFFDVDAEDPVIEYVENFEDGNEDFALNKSLEGEPAFITSSPEGFDNNGFYSFNNSAEDNTRIAVFQKPIVITSSGSTLSFDEIAGLFAGTDFGGNIFFSESVVLEATNDEGRNWVRLAEYSSEDDSSWDQSDVFFENVSSDIYKKREIKLSEIFNEGDEVYFKIEVNFSFSLPFNWGYIMDNFDVKNSVSTNEEAVVEGVEIKIQQNPFLENTRVEITSPNPTQIDQAYLINASGHLMGTQLEFAKLPNGKSFTIDGQDLPSGIYFIKIKVGNSMLTEKLVKL